MRGSKRDYVWRAVLLNGSAFERFTNDDVYHETQVEVSKRTIRDVLKTMEDMGFIEHPGESPHVWTLSEALSVDESKLNPKGGDGS